LYDCAFHRFSPAKLGDDYKRILHPNHRCPSQHLKTGSSDDPNSVWQYSIALNIWPFRGIEMKIGMIGAGAVGAAALMAILNRHAADEIIVLDQDINRAAGIVADMQYGSFHYKNIGLRAGNYPDLKGAELIIVTAGINEKAGGATDRKDPDGRMRLLNANAAVIREIIPKIVAVAPTAVLLIVSNPPEPLAELARQLAGHDRVLSAGTMIDSLRFRFHIAQNFQVTPGQVQATVIGEHGNSRIFLWSSARVGKTPLGDLLSDEELRKVRADVELHVRDANIAIIEGIGASQFGIGMACGRIAEAMAHDEQTTFLLGSHVPEYQITLSLPVILGRQGPTRRHIPEMTRDERNALDRTAEKLRAAMNQIVGWSPNPKVWPQERGVA